MSLEFVKVLLVFLFGLSSAENSNVIQPFIVNGTDTRIEDFPSMVSIRLKGDHLCGGTILNDEWILTAAHCLYGMPSDFSVQYATTVISQIGMNVAFAEKLVRHENYRPSIHKNDIGLLKLRTPLNITTFRKNYRATLAMIRSHYSTGSRAVLVGWGANSVNSIFDDIVSESH
ncbi:CLUMA_CG001774, isoform A [Clunio marinus]|uniref:CLUMA_CG001774, isoform A n=1 Tax=Clunio marinus TaxID=568069 RepID=A0A1J1HKQ0_9DIPT|nr:CLUMA_CG001774, isoform A [Clunio marinus]